MSTACSSTTNQTQVWQTYNENKAWLVHLAASKESSGSLASYIDSIDQKIEKIRRESLPTFSLALTECLDEHWIVIGMANEVCMNAVEIISKLNESTPLFNQEKNTLSDLLKKVDCLVSLSVISLNNGFRQLLNSHSSLK